MSLATTRVDRPAEKAATPATPRVSTARSKPSAEEERSIRRAVGMGVVIWPTFFLLDLFMTMVVHPDASLGYITALRIAGEATILSAWWLVTRPNASHATHVLANVSMCVVAAILVSLMSIELGGLDSAYIHGISLIILVEGSAVALPWSRSLLTTAPTAVAYPLVMGLAAFFDPEIAASWADPGQVATFASHYVFVLASLVISAAIAHSVWDARRELREARRLQRYRLEARIGQGGMNEVWLARDDRLKRQVALKILRSSEAEGVTLSRFEREAHATSQLSSPHTVRIFDFGASDDGVYFIAMEHLAGLDLREIVRKFGPLGPARAVHFAIQACRSLIEAHEAGIIHRDIKPANLFVTRIDDDEDGLKVLDFGIARVRQSDAQVTLSHPGAAIGTPAYMAPEVLTASTADERSDIYSLGATLYDLLTGGPPFSGADLHLVFVAHLAEAPVPPSQRRATDLPPRLEQIVLRCLAKKPTDRYASVRELLAELETCLDGPAWSRADAAAWWQAARLDALTTSGEAPLPPSQVA